MAGRRTQHKWDEPVYSIFPWTFQSTDDAHRSIANLGQLKATFSLRFEDLPPELPIDPLLDSDGDGLPDRWEVAHGLDPYDNGAANTQHGPSGMFGDSGTTSGQAYQAGVLAVRGATLLDFDGDGVPNDVDAAPENKFIDWEAPKVSTFVAITLPTAIAGFDQPAAYVAINDKFEAFCTTNRQPTEGDETIVGAMGGFIFFNGKWTPGVNQITEIPAASVTHLEPGTTSYPLTRRSTDLVGWYDGGYLTKSTMFTYYEGSYSTSDAMLMPDGGPQQSFCKSSNARASEVITYGVSRAGVALVSDGGIYVMKRRNLRHPSGK